jgi:signal transduction histidine kinase
MENVPLLPPFTARIRQIDNPLLANPLPANTFLPRQLHVAPYESYVGSPLAAGQDVHGWLSCYRRESEAFDVNEISLLVALARTLGVIVENHYLHQRVQAVAVYEERQRLARDLHDSVTQLVYSMTLFTRSAQEALEDEEWDRLAHNLAYMADTAREALREMRFLLFELQPPALEEEGLAKALQARLEMVERRIGISVDCQVDESLVSSAELARELYLVATEALNNMLKHADADRVSLVIARDNGSVRLSVLDDGRGFHPAQVSSGMGIKNMRQRIEALGGLLEIHSTPGAGTRIVATVPAVE